MRRSLRPALAVLPLAALALGAAGCSAGSDTGPEGPNREHQLRELATALQSRRVPARQADLPSMELSAPLAVQAIRSGEIVVVWGVAMPGEGETGTDAVIAYEAKTPSEGGYVLLHNGKVKEMTADEFRAAPRAR